MAPHIDPSMKRNLESCPRCSGDLQDGFAYKAAGLSFVSNDALRRRFVSWDEDLAQAGLRKFLPHRARYFRSQVCRTCQLYLVDYSRTYGHSEAKLLMEHR